MAKFQKGESGNPGGRPKLPEEIKEAAGAQTPAAIAVLASIMNNTDQPAAARVRAAEILRVPISACMSTALRSGMTLFSSSVYSITDELLTAEEWELERCRADH